MTFNPGLDVLPPDPVPESGVFLLPLCLTEEQLLIVLEAVELGGLALGYGRQGEHLLPFWQALSYIDDPENALCVETVTPEEKADIFDDAQAFLSGLADCEEEEEEEEMALQIQTINGIDYLVENCCGGATKHYQITRTGVDANGNPISIMDGGADNGFDFGSVSESNADCYAASATDYLISRADDWSNAVISFSFLAGDALVGLSDEIIDGVALLSQLLLGNSDLQTIQTFTTQQVSNALTDTTFRQTLIDAWTFNNTVTRNELRDWIDDAPYFVNGVPVRLILMSWLDFSIVTGYNRQLATLAATCESTVNLQWSLRLVDIGLGEDPPYGVLDPAGYYLTTVDGSGTNAEGVYLTQPHTSDQITQVRFTGEVYSASQSPPYGVAFVKFYLAGVEQASFDENINAIGAFDVVVDVTPVTHDELVIILATNNNPVQSARLDEITVS